MEMTTKLLYILVGNDEESPFRYTRSLLQSTLQFMGCKPQHAFKITQRVYEMMKNPSYPSPLVSAGGITDTVDKMFSTLHDMQIQEVLCTDVNHNQIGSEKDGDSITDQQFEHYKRKTSIVVSRQNFSNIICHALAEYKYVGPNQTKDLLLACRIRERKESMIILLCGTSGCGKSTLSSLLGNRLGVTTVISTDSIRHMMRSFADEEQNPLLWASTYNAGEHLDLTAVAKAKSRKMAKRLGHNFGNSTNSAELTISPKQMVIEGYKAQSEMVVDSLNRLITSWEDRKESVIVEGVHLSLNFVMGLMKSHPTVIPFMIYISNNDKHMERFAVRAKYMTLDPVKNKYVKYIRNIRAIQEYLCKRADKYLVPKLNNTNVDKSVAAIHATVFSCLRRRAAGEKLYDPATNTVTAIHEEYKNKCAAKSSKGMFQLIQRKGSSRQLMTLLNSNSSVALSWPIISSSDGNGKSAFGESFDEGVGYESAEAVHIQFGQYGISEWTRGNGETSYSGSRDGTVNSSRCNSPRISNGSYSKKLMEENSINESDDDDEVDEEHSEMDSDGNISDRASEEDDVEGSIEEESTKSDEEYEDLSILQEKEDGNGENIAGFSKKNDKSESKSGSNYSSLLQENQSPSRF